MTLVENGVTNFFLVPNADEQQLSEKASAICEDEKPSSSVKRLHKGILEEILTIYSLIRRANWFCFQVGNVLQSNKSWSCILSGILQ